MRLLPVLSIAAAVLTFTSAPASATTTQQPTVATPAWHGKTPPTYRNPLQLSLPGGGVAQSCADPTVIRGQQAHDSSWYLYCTSDALDSTLGTDGKPVIHNVPTFRSADMTSWKYVGDAFPTKPSWVAASGGVWAPEVTYQNGKYHLYYAASETRLPGGGSAVGVAVSNGPTGPWVDSGQPVVEPQTPPSATVGPRWEFDPEVITAEGHTYVYFGSYFGGIHARELTADGLRSLPATETTIAIDNRYEGTTIVKHGGWYYFMGSATNCCAGPLTGYSVFAARSRSPLGPFLDRDGRSILAGRVGGTPVITQNGNRWVGAGHNAVVTDLAGQDWTYYHAVDRNDPYYQGQVGYTKRPLLLDPLDWRSGWPVLRGDRGPSDQRVPGPVAQRGEVATYRPSFARAVTPGRPLPRYSDNFNGSKLSSRWTVVRPQTTAGPVVAAGKLSWPTQQADLHPEDPTTPLASVLTEPAPSGDYVVEARVAVDVPAEGCCQNYVQGGILVYQNDGNYLKLSSSSIFNTRQTEFGKEVTPVPAGYPHYGNSVVGPVGDSTYLRIVHRRVGAVNRYTSYTSLDGKRWDHGSTWTADLGSHPKIGLVSMGGSGFTSSFDYVRVSTLGHACRR
jgi:arabinan endo-1,5-alpha-L-arabinosidase